MPHSHKLSVWSAILVNINVMFGTGLFINTLMLTQRVGFWGFMSYLLVAVLVIPLIFGFGALLQKYPAGGFYAYGAHELGTTAGFVSAWAYFTGKLASAALLIHVFSTLISTIIPELSTVPLLALDIIVLLLFGWLNLYNMRTSKAVLYSFLVLKLTPVLFVIGSCLYLFKTWQVPAQPIPWRSIFPTIPLVLYAFTGFEACCSLSSALKNPRKDGPRALLLSVAFVITLTVIYQLLFFMTVGATIGEAGSPLLNVLPPLLNKMVTPSFIAGISKLLYLALAIASLGGSYGILFSNHWNLYTLAQHGHVFAKNIFTRLNIHQIPTAGIILEVLICSTYLFVAQGNLVTLQQLSVLGCTISFGISMMALLKNSQHEKMLLHFLLGFAGIISSAIFFVFSIQGFIAHGLYALYMFSGILGSGIIMFFTTNRAHTILINKQ